MSGLNTRCGGRFRETKMRGITADPNGNREQRRAARKLGVTDSPPDAGAPTCPDCGRTTHGFCCAGLLGRP